MDGLYNLLIVDDEKVIRRGLLSYDWNRLGFQAVDSAGTGKLALDKMAEEMPDVVLTDIRMPDMDGLELCKRIQSLAEGCKMVILTGYRDFDYAKTAIQAGVSGYLLKPVDPQELDRLFLKIKEELDQARESRRATMEQETVMRTAKHLAAATFLRNLTLELPHSMLELEEQASLLEISLHKPQYGAAILSRMSKASPDWMDLVNERIVQPSHGYFYTETADRTVLVLNPDHDGQGTTFFLETLLSGLLAALTPSGSTPAERPLLTAGHLYGQLTLLSRSYREADELAKKKQFEEQTSMFFRWREDETATHAGGGIGSYVHLYEIEHRFIQAVLNGNQEDMLKEWSLLREKLKQTDPAYTRNKLTQLLHLLDHQLGRHQLSLFALTGERMEPLLTEASVSMEQVNRHFTSYLLRVVERLNASLHQQTSSTQLLMYKAMAYIQENYNQRITLQEVADHIHLNPIYVSIQFKKEFGINFVDYVKELRIGKAKGLLKQTQLKIQQISDAVGYQNAKYFSDIFKAVTGLTPNEYRQSQP